MTGPAAEGLIWNVAGLLGEEPGAVREFGVDGVPVALDDETQLAQPVSGHVRFRRTNRGILVDADLRAALGTECSRCLRPMSIPVDIRIEEEFLPALDMTTGRPLATDEEPEVERLTDHHEVDLRPLVRDELLLAEPIAPVHSPDCPGLCPACGLPLDEGTRFAVDSAVDAALRLPSRRPRSPASHTTTRSTTTTWVCPSDACRTPAKVSVAPTRRSACRSSRSARTATS